MVDDKPVIKRRNTESFLLMLVLSAGLLLWYHSFSDQGKQNHVVTTEIGTAKNDAIVCSGYNFNQVPGTKPFELNSIRQFPLAANLRYIDEIADLKISVQVKTRYKAEPNFTVIYLLSILPVYTADQPPLC